MAAKKTAVRRKPGRKPIPNRAEIVARICEAVSAGVLVKHACEDEKITRKTLHQWVTQDAALGDAYARAREEQAHAWAEKALDVADGEDALTLLREEAIDAYGDKLADDGDQQAAQKVKALHANLIQRDKLRVDTLKWMASKLAPKSYGEKVTTEHTGEVKHEHRVLKWGDLEIPV